MKPILLLLSYCLSACLLLVQPGCSTTAKAPAHPHLVRVEGSGAKLRLEKRPASGSRYEWHGAVDQRGYATGPGTRTSYDKNGRKTQELDATFANGQPAGGRYELRQFSGERLLRQTSGIHDEAGKRVLSEKTTPHDHDTPESAYLSEQVVSALPLAQTATLDSQDVSPAPAPLAEPDAALSLESVEGLPIPRQRLARTGAGDSRSAARQQVTLESAVLSGIFFSSRSLALAELERHCLADIKARAAKEGPKLVPVPGSPPRWVQPPQVITRHTEVVNGKPREQYRATEGKLAADYYQLQ